MRLIVGAALLLAACGTEGPGSEGECSTKVDPVLDIGISDDGFVPVDEAGGEAVLVYGAQGGFHLEIAFRAEGLDTSGLAQVVTTGTLDGTEKALTNSWEQFRCNPDTNTEDAWNIRLIYDSTPPEMHNKDTDITATVTDAAGVEFTASTTVTMIDPEAR